MDNRVGEGRGGVAATYCIDYRVMCIVPRTCKQERGRYSQPCLPHTVGTTVHPSTNLDCTYIFSTELVLNEDQLGTHPRVEVWKCP
jgi:hypothetical protein